MAFYVQEVGFHDGETQVQRAMRVDMRDNPTVPALSPQLAYHLQVAPLIAIGTLDALKRPWTTVWGGESGLAQPLGGGVAGIRTQVTAQHDPVVETLFGQKAFGEVVHEEGPGRLLSGLTIDLEKRKRVKLCGRMIAGALTARNDEITGQNEQVAEVQLAMKIEQSLGNCPKYLNRKHIARHLSRPRLLADSARLSSEALALLDRADMFFMSTCGPKDDMDTNHRGGAPGFVRVVSNTDSGAVIVYPEYSGNRLYQSLGNIAVDPRIGLCVPDYETGDMLYMTGTATILIGPDAAKVLPRSNLAVQITLVAARYVADALPFRGAALDLSPYNPKVRFLTTEKAAALAAGASFSTSSRTATLISQTVLTPTISRFRFRLSPAPKPDEPPFVQPGQYVTLDFAPHLDMGYSHMRDDDPQSINDDFVRTFTVSSAAAVVGADGTDEFELTLRRVGVATKFLFQHAGPLGKSTASSASYGPRELDIGIVGFGGEFVVAAPDASSQPSAIAFIAAGVGITPLLPSLPTLDLARLRLLWSVRRADLGLVKDVIAQRPAVAACMEVFVTDATSNDGDKVDENIEQQLTELTSTGAKWYARRMQKQDLDGIEASISTYYLCTGVPMRNQLLEWLPGKTVVFEDFNF